MREFDERFLILFNAIIAFQGKMLFNDLALLIDQVLTPRAKPFHFFRDRTSGDSRWFFALQFLLTMLTTNQTLHNLQLNNNALT